MAKNDTCRCGYMGETLIYDPAWGPCCPMCQKPATLRQKRPGQARRTTIGKSKRQAVYKRDGFKCVECGSTENLTLDHIVPLSAGGHSRPSNLQTMCVGCNNRKSNALPRRAMYGR